MYDTKPNSICHNICSYAKVLPPSSMVSNQKNYLSLMNILKYVEKSRIRGRGISLVHSRPEDGQFLTRFLYNIIEMFMTLRILYVNYKFKRFLTHKTNTVVVLGFK